MHFFRQHRVQLQQFDSLCFWLRYFVWKALYRFDRSYCWYKKLSSPAKGWKRVFLRYQVQRWNSRSLSFESSIFRMNSKTWVTMKNKNNNMSENHLQTSQNLFLYPPFSLLAFLYQSCNAKIIVSKIVYDCTYDIFLWMHWWQTFCWFYKKIWVIVFKWYIKITPYIEW